MGACGGGEVSVIWAVVRKTAAVGLGSWEAWVFHRTRAVYLCALCLLQPRAAYERPLHPFQVGDDVDACDQEKKCGTTRLSWLVFLLILFSIWYESFSVLFV